MQRKVSIIIPVLNEEEELKVLLPYLENEVSPIAKDIIIAISSKDTSDYTHLCQSENIILHKCTCAGRSVQMNEGAEIASGDVYLFLHADVRPPTRALDCISKSIEKGKSAGFFAYRFDSSNKWLGINARATKKDGWHAGGGDQCQWMTADLFHSLGGYNSDLSIMEDFEMVATWRKMNIPYELIQECAVVSARKYQNNSYLWVNLVNLTTVILFQLGLNTRSLRKLYTKLLSA